MDLPEDEGHTSPSAETVLDGGEVTQSADLDVKVTDVDSERRGKLAFILVFLLAILILFHYAAIFALEWNGKKDPKTLETAFNVTLPVISGLVASAVTYYFTRGGIR